MKNKIGTIITVIAILIGGAMGKGVVRSFFNQSGTKNIVQELEKAAIEINSSCPKLLDEETRLDGAKSGPGKKFSYYYTLVKYSAQEVEKSIFDKDIAPEIKKIALKGDGIRTMLGNGIFVEYHYSGKNGKFISMVKIDPSDLKK